MGVSKNRGGPPKSSILIGFSIINHPFWGTCIFGNTHVFPIVYQGAFQGYELSRHTHQGAASTWSYATLHDTSVAIWGGFTPWVSPDFFTWTPWVSPDFFHLSLIKSTEIWYLIPRKCWWSMREGRISKARMIGTTCWIASSSEIRKRNIFPTLFVSN